jgi:hypothetical protein
VAEVAARYGVTEHTVLGWVAAGDLRALDVRRAGARRPRWRVTPEALAEFEARRSPAAAVAPRRRRQRPADVIEFYRTTG